MSKPLEYDFEDGTHVIFNKYTIENGVIKNKRTGKPLSYSQVGKYNVCGVISDDGIRRNIRVCRAVASTSHGPPPTLEHTADHKDKNRGNDADDNIRWLCKNGQVKNRTMPTTLKSAYIIVKDELEKTEKDWVEHLKDEKNRLGRKYTESMISHYAQRKQYGFSFKEYPDLPGELWKEVPESNSDRGRWEISNMNRVKYITKYAENVLSGERIGIDNVGYPIIRINGTIWRCHILSFSIFFPDEYDAKKKDEIVLHQDDDKSDFRPHKLRLGTRSENGIDAHNNGKYDGTKSERVACASYINDALEKEHDSMSDAMRYLKSLGYTKAAVQNINTALNPESKYIFAYDRVWKKV